MIRFCLLGSGSSGNAILVSSQQTKILIDNGLSYKQLALRAAEVGEDLEGLAAVFVSHEHSDHVQGLGVLARRAKVPVYLTEKTHQSLPISVGEIPRVELFESGDAIEVADLRVISFSVCHDAADPVSYVVESNGAKLGIASDLGRVSTLVRNRLSGAHGLLLESNYCPNMLRHGPYPATLQQRIRGDRGHLSNGDMNSLLAELLHEALQVVVLVHVSEENNTPDLAYTMAARILERHRAKLHVAKRHQPTGVFEIQP